MSEYALNLAQNLINKKSVTPEDDGAIALLITELEKLGFNAELMPFSEAGYPTIQNFYAKLGNSNKNLAFAGHTDVVPAGDETKWHSPPFTATIRDNKLYGRGAVDMKCAITAYIGAVKTFLENNPNFNDSLSFIITGDEEDISINGTVKMVEELKQRNEQISLCIVGEPTNPGKIGEMLKIGRRGSVNFELEVYGQQGHVAYPENALNPITALVKLLNLLTDHQFDHGNEFFDPTNLEITSFDVANPATNVIPETARAKFNIRFSSEYQSKDLIELITDTCARCLPKHNLTYKVSGESFYNNNREYASLVQHACEKVTGLNPVLSTTGGTSDARFIKDICPTIECGLINKTAHQIDEHIALADLEILEKIYLQIIEDFFKS